MRRCAFTARYELKLYMRFSFILIFQDLSCGTAVPRSDASVRQNRLIHLMATHNVRNNSVTALHSHFAPTFFGANFDLLSFLPTRTTEYTVIEHSNSTLNSTHPYRSGLLTSIFFGFV